MSFETLQKIIAAYKKYGNGMSIKTEFHNRMGSLLLKGICGIDWKERKSQGYYSFNKDRLMLDVFSIYHPENINLSYCSEFFYFH